MSQFLVPSPNRAAEEQLARALAQQLGSLTEAMALVRHGLQEIRTTHCTASDTASTTLATAQQMIDEAASAGRLPPLKQAALYHRTQAYLFEMLAIADDTGGTIGDLLMRWVTT